MPKRLGLSDEIVEHLRAQGTALVFGQALRAQGRVGFGHGLQRHPLGASRRSAARISSAVVAVGASPAACATAAAASPGA